MNLFDLHCDTPFELYKKQTALSENGLHISLKKAECYRRYAQVMAIWTQHSLDGEAAWEQFLAIRGDFLSKIPSEQAALCTSSSDYRRALSENKRPLFLAVEGASLLCGKPERLSELYRLGVRFLTLVWRDADIIGGAFDTDLPLTPFGREVVKDCFSLGMIVDVSHASDAVTQECLVLAREAGVPVIATHSNSRAVWNNSRNLTDDMFRAIAQTGGVAGYNVCAEFTGEKPTLDTMCDHILHFMELDPSGKHIALGGDLDGITEMPAGFEGVQSWPALARRLLERGLEEETVGNIFWNNAIGVMECAVCDHAK